MNWQIRAFLLKTLTCQDMN